MYKVKHFCTSISLKTEDYEGGIVLYLGEYDIYVLLGISHHHFSNACE